MPRWQHDLERAVQQRQFEATLPAKLDETINNWHTGQPPATSPIIVHEPIDPELQTGESKDLGGPISIHAPWKRE